MTRCSKGSSRRHEYIHQTLMIRLFFVPMIVINVSTVPDVRKEDRGMPGRRLVLLSCVAATATAWVPGLSGLAHPHQRRHRAVSVGMTTDGATAAAPTFAITPTLSDAALASAAALFGAEFFAAASEGSPQQRAQLSDILSRDFNERYGALVGSRRLASVMLVATDAASAGHDDDAARLLGCVGAEQASAQRLPARLRRRWQRRCRIHRGHSPCNTSFEGLPVFTPHLL